MMKYIILTGLIAGTLHGSTTDYKLQLKPEQLPIPSGPSILAKYNFEIPEREFRSLKADAQISYRFYEKNAFTVGVYKHTYGRYIDPNQGIFGGYVIRY